MMDTQEPNGYRVTTEIVGGHRHPALTEYPLLEDDLLVQDPEDGTFMKVSPGIAIGGFVLTPEQVATLTPVVFTTQSHLEFRVVSS